MLPCSLPEDLERLRKDLLGTEIEDVDLGAAGSLIIVAADEIRGLRAENVAIRAEVIDVHARLKRAGAEVERLKSYEERYWNSQPTRPYMD